MAQLTHTQYDALERAIVDGRRITVRRRGNEYIVIPKRLHMVRGKETIDATHPTTGERLTLALDDLDEFDVVP